MRTYFRLFVSVALLGLVVVAGCGGGGGGGTAPATANNGAIGGNNGAENGIVNPANPTNPTIPGDGTENNGNGEGDIVDEGEGEADGDIGAGEDPQGGTQPGGTEIPANGGAEGQNGGNDGGENGGEVALTDAFYEPWYFRTITFYAENGETTNVGAMSGTLDFERDGTFKWFHQIGTLWSQYEGTYRVEGNRIVFTDRYGNPIAPHDFSLGNIEGKDRMVLTNYHPSGAKFIIMGLESSK